jgi:hypothetical protein
MKVPADPTANLLLLFTFVAVAVGAIGGPALTLYMLPDKFPTMATVFVVIGQEILLLALVVAATFRVATGKRQSD